VSRRRSRVTSVKARQKIRAALKNTQDFMGPAMKAEADLLRDEIKQNAPRDTGEMVDLVTSFVAKNGLRAEAGFRGKKTRQKAFYARFFEYGTKGGTVSVGSAKVLSGAGGTFGTTANIPARPAQPFIQPAWDKHKKGIVQRISKKIKFAMDVRGIKK
jgi:HK97 gp10 family phage protein